MEGNLLESLRNLLKLQQIDSELDDINETTGDLPDEIKKLEIEVSYLNEKVKITDSKLTELRSNRTNANITIQELKDRLIKLNDKLANVKNNKEYDASVSEIESAKNDINNFGRSLSVLDSEEVSLMREVENLRREIEEKMNF